MIKNAGLVFGISNNKIVCQNSVVSNTNNSKQIIEHISIQVDFSANNFTSCKFILSCISSAAFIVPNLPLLIFLATVRSTNRLFIIDQLFMNIHCIQACLPKVAILLILVMYINISRYTNQSSKTTTLFYPINIIKDK